MSLLPIFLKLASRRGLVVGAGDVARDKVADLLKTDLEVTVVAPEVHPDVRQWAAAGLLTLHERPFTPADTDGCFVVIAATGQPEVNAAVYREAGARGILTNSVDDPGNCDFFFGSVVRRGDLQVAISTAGESPALSRRLRQEIDAQLPEDMGLWLREVGRLRREVLAVHPRSEERRLLLHRLVQQRVCELANCPARQMALSRTEAEPSPAEDEEEEPRDDGDNFVFCDDADPAPEYAQEPALPEYAGAAEKVYLVGAGPGDPDLLTVKAVHLIQTADVILHDDLVPQPILDYASPSALIVPVGKRCGEKTITQDQINELMIAHARAGRSVVRLKGGDPMLFGRAAEELEALSAAGIPAEAVPGITAGFAAAAALGRSLTRRGGAASVVLETGHHAQQPPLHTEDDLESTRIVYMPGRDLRPLAEEWLREGLPADLPCALVSRASLPDQQIVRTTLGELAKIAPVPAPGLLIAGQMLLRQGTEGTREQGNQDSSRPHTL